MNTTKIILMILLPMNTLLAGSAQTFHVDNFKGSNDRELINNALSHMTQIPGSKRLIFSKREYIVEPINLNTYEPIIGATKIEQLSIEGNGATIVLKNALNCQKGYAFKLNRFKNVSIKDLSLTHRPLPYIQGTISDVDQERNHVQIKLSDKFNHAQKLQLSPNSEFWSRTGLPQQPHCPKPNSPSWLKVTPTGNGSIASDTEEKNIKNFKAGFFNKSATLGGTFNWKKGDPIVIWKRGAQDALYFEEGENLHLDNITVHSSLHYGIKLRGIKTSTIENSSITPVADGMLSTSADGIDVQQSNNISIINCDLISTGDDAISFLNHKHGYNGYNYEKKFQSPYPETNNTATVRGNRIIGGNRNGILMLGDNVKIESNKLSHVRQYGLKFTGNNTYIRNNHFDHIGSFAAYKHITDELNTGIICSDEWAQHNAVIEHNSITNWQHMPGILIKSLRNTQVTNNTFIISNKRFMTNKPFNSYLSQNKAICITNGLFQNTLIPCSGISVSNNKTVTPIWNTFNDAVHVHEKSTDIRINNNSSKRIHSN